VIPELQQRIAVTNAVVTIDPMGCQKEIARHLVAGGRGVVLAVKDNQPRLHAAVVEDFLGHRERDLAGLRHRARETTPGRGRWATT
jgi:predicted transposase YbfD/YdcC